MGPQLPLNLETAEPFRWRDFVVSPSNESAVAVLAEWPDAAGGALALVGPEGSGKTHLATAWAERCGAILLNDVAADIIDLPDMEGRCVVVDDADRVDDETLFHLINQAGIRGGCLLLTSRTAPSSWSAALPDLRSRLDALRTLELQAPDDVVLWALLERFFRQSAIRPSRDLLEYLVRRIERSAPQAREVVARLHRAAVSDHRPVTRALAREVLESESGEGVN